MIKRFISLVFSGLLMATASAQTADNVGKEAIGTVNDYTPDTSLVLDIGSGEPVQYKFAKKVTFVDAGGEEVQASGLRTNLRIRVHYLEEGGDLLIDKVTLME